MATNTNVLSVFVFSKFVRLSKNLQKNSLFRIFRYVSYARNTARTDDFIPKNVGQNHQPEQCRAQYRLVCAITRYENFRIRNQSVE